jgi:SAM-dependent methyltransferase
MESSDSALALPAVGGPLNRSQSEQDADHAGQLRLLQRFLTPATTFLELCDADYSLALTIADRVKRTYAAVDDSAAPITGRRLPANFHLALAHRVSVPVPPSSIGVAYTRCGLDRLRPAEALDLLAEVYRALAPNGTFLCMAVSRLLAPTEEFAGDDVRAARTTYSIAELRAMLRKVGFRRVTQYACWRDTYTALPTNVLHLFEATIAALAPGRSARMCRSSIVRAALDIRLAARK